MRDVGFSELRDFGPEREARSLATAAAMRALAAKEGLAFLDLTTLAGASTGEDGLHFDATASAVIGKAAAALVRRALRIPVPGASTSLAALVPHAVARLGAKRLKESGEGK